MEKILLRVGGGLGRNVIASRIVAQIKQDHPDSILRVIASYPDVFINNPNIDRVYHMMGGVNPDFYEANKDFDIWDAEPYIDLAYRQGKEHIVDVWCRKLGLSNTDKLNGEIFLTDEEIEWANQQKSRLNTKAPIVAIQISGGVSSYQQQDALDVLRPKQIRALPVEIAQEVVDQLFKDGFIVLQIGLPSEKKLEKVMFIEAGNNQPLSNRLIFATLNSCDHLISIDSMAQHVWAALGKKNATVIWGATNPKSLGYSCNNNMSRPDNCGNKHCNRPEGFLMDVVGNGQAWQCPKKGICMKFSAKEIISAFNSTIETKGEQK